ncbi:hypothetical protein N431DRAFT_178724 [Stipitochalara longipes BDJ]|nr:hypothetical protein N431DRAFT_178724 [Stipitochalara longipes BDJ]
MTGGSWGGSICCPLWPLPFLAQAASAQSSSRGLHNFDIDNNLILRMRHAESTPPSRDSLDNTLADHPAPIFDALTLSSPNEHLRRQQSSATRSSTPIQDAVGLESDCTKPA